MGYGIVLEILQMVARWKIFEKAGERGWKALIPFYADYLFCKIAWDGRVFWLVILGSLAMAALTSLLGAWSFFPVLLFSIGLFMVVGIYTFKLAKAYGKGKGFAIGLFLLPFIFELILGFDDSVYLGPQ